MEPLEKGGHKRGYPHSHLNLGAAEFRENLRSLRDNEHKPQLRLDGGDIRGGERYPKALRSVEISIILLGGKFYFGVLFFCCELQHYLPL